MTSGQLLAAVAAAIAGLLLLWALAVLALWRTSRRAGAATGLREALRLVPDLLRLLGGLARDPQVPRGVRVRLGLLLVYLASPLDLVPDVVPVVGYADDVLLVAVVLRSVVRRAGPGALERHWPGSPEGLAAVRALARVPPAPTP